MKVDIGNRIVAERLRDRAKGSLWGLIVGDCLGSPFQFGPRREDFRWEGSEKGALLPMLPCRTFDCPPGHWTDDGSMALCIIDSFNRKGRLDVKDVGETFLRWYRDGYLSSKARSFDVGGATASGIMAFGATGSLVNGSEGTQGNGAIMRFAPSFFAAEATAQDAAEADALMCAIGDITHASSVVHGDILRMAGIFRRHLYKGRATAEYAECRDGEIPNGGWSVSTLKAACAYFHLFPEIKDSLTAAALAGGDSDTIAAVTGQVAGSFRGFSAIPSVWVKAVKDWRKIDAMVERFLDLTVGREEGFQRFDDQLDPVSAPSAVRMPRRGRGR